MCKLEREYCKPNYKVEFKEISATSKELVHLLNELGKEGFDVMDKIKDDQGVTIKYILRRKLELSSTVVI